MLNVSTKHNNKKQFKSVYLTLAIHLDTKNETRSQIRRPTVSRRVPRKS